MLKKDLMYQNVSGGKSINVLFALRDCILLLACAYSTSLFPVGYPGVSTKLIKIELDSLGANP